jgi:hypothetical protein
MRLITRLKSENYGKSSGKGIEHQAEVLCRGSEASCDTSGKKNAKRRNPFAKIAAFCAGCCQ